MQQHQGRTLYIHNESLMRHFKDAMRWCWKLWGEGRFIDPLKDLSQLALVPLSLVTPTFLQLEKRSLASLSDWADLAKASPPSTYSVLLVV